MRVGSSPTDRRTQATPLRRVLIADDYDLVRDGFRILLGYEEDLEVVGEAKDGLEAESCAGAWSPTWS